MMATLTFVGSLVIAAIGFLFGRFFAETEKILSEKRAAYTDFLSILPPLQDAYVVGEEDKIIAALRPAVMRVPKLLFYADASVLKAWDSLHKAYHDAYSNLSEDSGPLAEEYKRLAKAQNDLVLEMRRDAFRWSIFNYSGKRRETYIHYDGSGST